MAIDSRNMKNRIMDKTDKITEHLLKCLLIQDTTHNLNHWSQEIYGFMYSLPKLKRTNKLPSKEMIYNCINDYIGDTLLDNIDTLVKNINYQENTNITDYDKQSLYNCIMSYYNWLSSQLSIGAVENIEVKNQINTLINKYNSESGHKQKEMVTQ